ncbi:hypothetical protein JCM11641_006881 [Rhodosporidiobolus odoratus]
MSISLWITSPDTHSERRFSPALTIASLKAKLEPITGIPYSTQLLSLRRTRVGAGHSGSVGVDGELLTPLDDDARTLEDYGVREYMTIRVESSDPHAQGLGGQSTDDSQVEKFELTQAEYESRRDTVLAYKQRHHLGRFAPSPSSPSSSNPSSAPAPPSQLPSTLLPGARCQVSLSDILVRRGAVRFVGSTEFGASDESIWVGVEWDEPVGKGDGAVDGKRYFQTPPLRASFVRPDKVTVGDFPELDPFAEEELEDEEMEM